jgi:hypothetical protein
MEIGMVMQRSIGFEKQEPSHIPVNLYIGYRNQGRSQLSRQVEFFQWDDAFENMQKVITL